MRQLPWALPCERLCNRALDVRGVGIEGDRVRHGRPMCLQRLRRWLALLTSCRPPRLTRPSGGGRWFHTARELTNRERCAGQWVRSAGPHTWCVFMTHLSWPQGSWRLMSVLANTHTVCFFRECFPGRARVWHVLCSRREAACSRPIRGGGEGIPPQQYTLLLVNALFSARLVSE